MPKGQALGVYLMLPGWTADKSLQTLPWNGSADLLQFEVRVPANQRPGEITGVVTVGRGGETLGQADFRLMVTDESA